MIKCTGCKGEGVRTKTFRRVTTFIDVMEDKSNLQAWGERMVLLGIAEDWKFAKGALDIDATSSEGKNELNRRAKAAKEKAGASRKADQGTHLHAMSELVDQGLNLPTGIPIEDVMDMMAYKQGTTPFFKIEHMERLVVNDDLGVAGTPDRVSSIDVENISKLLERKLLNEEAFEVVDGVPHLIAPDGSLIGPDELLITDLKTGTVEYGALKMAMQLAIYSRSKLYIKDSTERGEMLNVNQKWGVIMHLAAGSGELVLYWTDLSLGWRAVECAAEVHELRRLGRRALQPALLMGTKV